MKPARFAAAIGPLLALVAVGWRGREPRHGTQSSEGTSRSLTISRTLDVKLSQPENGGSIAAHSASIRSLVV